MRKLFCILLVFAMAFATAAECRKHHNAYVNLLERGVPFLLKNQLTSYVITFRYTNPSPSQSGRVQIAMPAPVNKTGYSRFDFVHVVINGIDSRLLEPKKYDIFNTPEAAGVDVLYNFNGVQMVLRFSVTDTSPLLNMSWSRAEGNSTRPIESASIYFTVLPSASGKAKNSYARELLTPRGLLKPKAKARMAKENLGKEDKWIIMQDEKYQYSDKASYAAPVLLCPDWKGIVSGTASFGVQQDVALSFKLDAQASFWSFGMLDTEKKRSNADFLAFVKEIIAK